MAPRDDQRFTFYGWSTCLWVLIISFQYGWHISVLNQIQAVLTCHTSSAVTATTVVPETYLGLPTCIPMSDAAFSSITSIFCAGGLLGSLAGDRAMNRWGRKGAAKASASMFALGAAIMGFAWSLSTLLIGRFLVGVGAGGLSVAPLFLAEIAPAHLKGPIGSLNQMGVVLGIMFTQIAGFGLATPKLWRLVLLVSSGLAIFQIMYSPFVCESPVWLRMKGRSNEVDAIHAVLYAGLPPREDDVEDPLLAPPFGDDDEPITPAASRTKETVTIPELLRTPELRRPLIGVCLLFLSQQISGVNAILYYSNAILSKSFPTLGPYVSLAITLVNVVMTVPAIFLIERLGRKTLLFGSATGAAVALVLCGLGLDSGSAPLASFSILFFISAFAIGMGPVPFVLIPEISPAPAVASLSSVGLALHWVVNYTVGQSFLPLRNWLAGGDTEHEGRVFYVFAGAFGVSMLAFARVYRGLKQS